MLRLIPFPFRDHEIPYPPTGILHRFLHRRFGESPLVCYVPTPIKSQQGSSSALFPVSVDL